MYMIYATNWYILAFSWGQQRILKKKALNVMGNFRTFLMKNIHKIYTLSKDFLSSLSSTPAYRSWTMSYPRACPYLFQCVWCAACIDCLSDAARCYVSQEAWTSFSLSPVANYQPFPYGSLSCVTTCVCVSSLLLFCKSL